MAHFAVQLEVPVSAREAWERVLDLQRQEEVIPFTTVRRSPVPGEEASAIDVGGGQDGPSGAGDLRVGTRFVGRTALGPVGFEDPMLVEALRTPTHDVPGFARIRKEGNVIGGWIDLVVADEAGGPPERPLSRVTWSQVISVRWVPRWLDPFVATIARVAYRWALRRLLERD